MTTDEARSSTFTAFKDRGGRWRWLALASNRFRDKVGEVFPEESHKEYCSYVEATGDYPLLRLWHIPGSEVGRADFVAYADGFRVDSGTFFPGNEDLAGRLASSGKPQAVSIGYRYKLTDLVDGVYRRYRSFEDSILPAEHAANPWTEFTVSAVGTKEATAMKMTATQRQFLVDHLGEAATKAIEERLPEAEKALMDAGIAFKQVEAGEPSKPFGGATSWPMLDQYLKAQKQMQATVEVSDAFSMLTSNILSSEMDAKQKAAALELLAGTLEARIAVAAAEKALAARGAKAHQAFEYDPASSWQPKPEQDEPATSAGRHIADLLTRGAVRA